MLKFASFALFVIYALLPVIHSDDQPVIRGAAGQNCTPDDDDNPELCTKKGQWIVDKSTIECKENYDCCLCGVLKCSPNCDGFKANGDYSAYYVPHIIIDGNDDDGAEIDCDGDSSCEGVVVAANNVKGIKCGGDFSCRRSEMKVDCIDPCKVECDGDKSCKKANMRVTNVEGVHCGDSACLYSQFTIIDPDDDFKLECGAEKSCKFANIKIIVDGNKVSKLKSIDCGSLASCIEASITIENKSSKKVTVSEINCEGERACRRSKWKVVGNIEVENCDCSDDACTGATFDGFTCNGAP